MDHFSLGLLEQEQYGDHDDQSDQDALAFLVVLGDHDDPPYLQKEKKIQL